MCCGIKRGVRVDTQTHGGKRRIKERQEEEEEVGSRSTDGLRSHYTRPTIERERERACPIYLRIYVVTRPCNVFLTLFNDNGKRLLLSLYRVAICVHTTAIV